MIRRTLAASIAMIMVTDLIAADQNIPVKTNWTGFREQVTQQKLANRNVWILLTSGEEIKARLIGVEESGVSVKSNAATRRWASGKEEAMVPRDVVARVRFSGRVGKGALLGGLAGLGGGAAVAGGVAAGMGNGSCEGPSCGAVLLVIPLAAVGGSLIGRATQKPAPVFVIQPPNAISAEGGKTDRSIGKE